MRVILLHWRAIRWAAMHDPAFKFWSLFVDAGNEMLNEGIALTRYRAFDFCLPFFCRARLEFPSIVCPIPWEWIEGRCYEWKDPDPYDSDYYIFDAQSDDYDF